MVDEYFIKLCILPHMRNISIHVCFWNNGIYLNYLFSGGILCQCMRKENMPITAISNPSSPLFYTNYH